MRFKKVFVNWGRQEVIAGYLQDYLVKDGLLIIEEWIADILISHGYALLLKSSNLSHKRKNKKCNRKGSVDHKEIIK